MSITHKKHLLKFCAFILFGVLGAAQAQAFTISIKFEFGKHTTEGDCGPGRGICSVTIGGSLRVSSQGGGLVSADAQVKGDTLLLTFPNGLPAQAKGEDGRIVIPIPRELALDPATAKSLGFSRVILLPGEYLVDGNSVRIKVSTSGKGTGADPVKGGDKKNKN